MVGTKKTKKQTFQLNLREWKDLSLAFTLQISGKVITMGGSNTEHSNSESIRKPTVLKFGFRTLGTMDVYSYGTDHSKTELWLAQVVLQIKKIFFISKATQTKKNGRPFENRTKSTIRNPNMFGIRAPTVFNHKECQQIFTQWYCGDLNNGVAKKYQNFL